MTSQSRSSIANRLSAASLAINNTTSDHEIGTLVTVHGYTAAKMDEGRQLYLRAADAVKKQTFASGAQRKATQQAQAAELRARAQYTCAHDAGVGWHAASCRHSFSSCRQPTVRQCLKRQGDQHLIARPRRRRRMGDGC
jgi:hypothetical protein